MAFLVGGFAASPWLFYRLKDILSTMGLQLSRPDNHTSVKTSFCHEYLLKFDFHSNKAVAEGAVSYYLQRFVSVRMARLTYGSSCCIDFDEADAEHHIRRGNIYYRASGEAVLPDAYTVMITKVCYTIKCIEDMVTDRGERALQCEKTRRWNEAFPQWRHNYLP